MATSSFLLLPLFSSLRSFIRGYLEVIHQKLLAEGLHKLLIPIAFTTKMIVLNRCIELMRSSIKRIPIELISDWHGYRFNDNGWHYLRDLVAEILINPEIRLQQTNYWKFFKHPRILDTKHFDDQLFFHKAKGLPTGDKPFYLNTMPWGFFTKKLMAKGGIPSGKKYDFDSGSNTLEWSQQDVGRHVWYHPSEDHALTLQFEKIRKLTYSIKSEGFHPFRSRSPFIRVAVMERTNGSRRYIRCDGLHRLAVAAQLGVGAFWVQIPPSAAFIRETEVESWYYVRKGHCTKEHALCFFHAFFELTGRERLEALHLNSSY